MRKIEFVTTKGDHAWKIRYSKKKKEKKKQKTKNKLIALDVTVNYSYLHFFHMWLYSQYVRKHC